MQYGWSPQTTTTQLGGDRISCWLNGERIGGREEREEREERGTINNPVKT